MNNEWLKDCKTEEAKDDRRKMVRSATPTLNVLKMIVERYLRDEEQKRLSKAAYESPSWAYLQADANGAVRILKLIQTLLDQEDTK